jgi:hypothetical protein
MGGFAYGGQGVRETGFGGSEDLWDGGLTWYVDNDMRNGRTFGLGEREILRISLEDQRPEIGFGDGDWREGGLVRHFEAFGMNGWQDEYKGVV